MREIKFRVWDNVDYMSSPFTLTDIQFKKIGFGSDCPVMQFTGLKDKNGKEIYEGDIINGTLKKIVCIVSYDEHTGGFYAKESDVIGYKLCIPEGTYGGGKLICPFEIIGNIYENPELLKRLKTW